MKGSPGAQMYVELCHDGNYPWEGKPLSSSLGHFMNLQNADLEPHPVWLLGRGNEAQK